MTKMSCRKRCGIVPIVSILVIAAHCLLLQQHTSTFAAASVLAINTNNIDYDATESSVREGSNVANSYKKETEEQSQRSLIMMQTYGITIDKDHYNVGEPIVYTVTIPPAPTEDDNLSIIRTADIGTFIIGTTPTYYGGIVPGTLTINWSTIFDTLTPEECTGPNVIAHNFSSYGPFTVIQLNPSGLIIDKSRSFSIGVAEEILNLNESYYPGEAILVNTTNTKFVLSSNPLQSDGYKIFKVPYSFKNNSLLFNTVPVFRDVPLIFPNGLYVINWDEPGLFQLVTYVKGPYNIVKGISSVFEVKQNDAISTTTFSIDAVSYQPAEVVPITLTRLAATPYNLFIEFRFISANATTNDDFEHYMGKSLLQWTSNTTTMTFYPKIHFIDNGAYKLTAYLEDQYRLGTSKPFEVTKASLIRVDMTMRTFDQGERVSLNVFNPYFDFENDFLFGRAGVLFGGYEYATKSAGRDEMVVKGVDPGNFFVENLKPGYYKFAVNRFALDNFDDIFPDKIVLTISNTTFRVRENKGILKSDQGRYRKGEMLKLTLSSTANIPLCGKFPGVLTNRDFVKVIEFTNNDYTFNSRGECVGSTSLTYETLIDWSPQGSGDTKVEVKLGRSDILFARRWFNVRN